MLLKDLRQGVSKSPTTPLYGTFETVATRNNPGHHNMDRAFIYPFYPPVRFSTNDLSGDFLSKRHDR